MTLTLGEVNQQGTEQQSKLRGSISIRIKSSENVRAEGKYSDTATPSRPPGRTARGQGAALCGAMRCYSDLDGRPFVCPVWPTRTTERSGGAGQCAAAAGAQDECVASELFWGNCLPPKRAASGPHSTQIPK